MVGIMSAYTQCVIKHHEILRIERHVRKINQ